MMKYITKRVFISVIIVWGVLTVTFLIIHLAPGDPASIYTSPEIPKETLLNLREQMGFNRPLITQYFIWTGELLQGNFGLSFSYKRPVIDIFKETIPNTLQLTVVVFIIQLVLGCLFGIIAAIKVNKNTDRIINILTLIIYSVPGYWLALISVLIFSYKLGWFPSSQMFTLGITGGFWEIALDRFRHLVLPATVLILPFAAYTARFVRGSFCEVMKQSYIRTALAYGLNRRKIYFRYALKNALLPVATLIGIYLPFLLGGAVITEYIFSWPGMGRITVEAIFTHDFPLILGSTFVAASAVVLGNFLSDMLYLIIDPRIKTGRF